MLKKSLYFAIAIFLVVSLQASAAEETVVFANKAKIYSSPGKKSFQIKVIATVDQGAKALLIEETDVASEKWYKVKLPDNVIGWVEAKYIESSQPKAAQPPAAGSSEMKKQASSPGPSAPGGTIATAQRTSLPLTGSSAFDRYTLKAPLLDADIKEEVISIDTKDPLYAPYFRKLSNSIQANIIYPIDAYQARIEGKVFLSFSLQKSGQLVGVKLINSSGYKALDNAAIDAVQLASPFESFPEDIKKEGLNVSVDFLFKPVYPVEEEKAKPKEEEQSGGKPLFERKFR